MAKRTFLLALTIEADPGDDLDTPLMRVVANSTAIEAIQAGLDGRDLTTDVRGLRLVGEV